MAAKTIIRFALNVLMCCAAAHAQPVLQYKDFLPPPEMPPAGEVGVPGPLPGMVRIGDVVRGGDGLESPLHLALQTHHLHERIKDAPGVITTGSFTDERITQDADGNLYTLAQADGKHYLLHSIDRGATWLAYSMPPSDWSRIEFNDSPTRRPTNPPAVLLFGKSGLLQVLLPTLDRCGHLEIGDPIDVATDSLLVPNHSGAGNSVVSVGPGRVAIAYPSTEQVEDASGGGGTKIKVSIISRRLGTVLRTVEVGHTTVGKPDPHDIPAITLDSNGVLHVVYCGHHTDLWHTRSLTRGFASWSEPQRVGLPKTAGGHTYTAMVIDRDDQLHVVTRYAGDTRGQGGGNYHFGLCYNRLNADGTWQDQRLLVDPGRAMYAIWYHRLSIDADGRLILTSPGLLAAQMVVRLGEFELYDRLFPGELKRIFDPVRGVVEYQSTQKPHGPFMLISEDGGDTWRPATQSAISD